MNSTELKKNALNLTQRLDHMVPDEEMSASQNQKAASDLGLLSAKLFWHVPDQSLSPFERLERLARAADGSTPDLSQLQSAAKKLEALKSRIDILVPGNMSHEKKIEVLIEKLNEKVGVTQLTLHTTEKLELLGDSRAKIAPEIKAISTKKKKTDK